MDQRTLTLTYARAYAETGLPVFPLHGKKPATRHGLKDATTDLVQISQWFDNTNGHNIGLPVPPGCVVLDVDPRSGGIDGLKRLEAEHGPLPPTTVSVSGRGDGGHHQFFKSPPDQPYTDRHLPDGLDIRAGGKHYVVAPPSVHPVTGGHYYFQEPVTPVAEVPRWLLDRLRPPIRPVQPPTPRQGSTGEHLINWVTNLQEGERNHGLFWAACTAIEEGVLDHIRADLEHAGLHIGLPAHEVQATIRSAERRTR
ncbi:bifunctional DNA primase/polymerase [Auritidibacter ignavus]|uniref:bifunctional DNA primase/polymerase n=1 Tax=Auritidibacter ignavus TaxID=678932 RepID=UPI003CC58178